MSRLDIAISVSGACSAEAKRSAATASSVSALFSISSPVFALVVSRCGTERSSSSATKRQVGKLSVNMPINHLFDGCAPKLQNCNLITI